MKLIPVLFLLVLGAILACKKDPLETRYFPTVKTILQINCFSCHSPGGQGMPVVFVTDEDISSRAASIKAATIDPVSPQNKRMPQGGELSQSDKDIIQKWFEKGGKVSD